MKKGCQARKLNKEDAMDRCRRRKLIKVSNKCIAVRKVATPLRELTCHMGSHSVICHPAEATFPPDV